MPPVGAETLPLDPDSPSQIPSKICSSQQEQLQLQKQTILFPPSLFQLSLHKLSPKTASKFFSVIASAAAANSSSNAIHVNKNDRDNFIFEKFTKSQQHQYKHIAETTDNTDFNKRELLQNNIAKFMDFPVTRVCAIIFAQILSFAFILNVEEYSPLVLFSWWRNKIS